jgi:hypothetical protein
VRQDELLGALRPSNLCADFATGAAGGFAAIPAATGAFLRAADPALRATRSNTSLLELMRPYVTPDEAAATRRVSRLQREAHRLYGGIGTAGLKALNTALYGS